MLPLITNLFFPKTSLTGEIGTWMTPREKQTIEDSLRPLLLHEALLRKQHLRNIDAIVAATTYGSSPLLRTLLHRYKYQRIQEIHRELSEWMRKAIPGLLIPPNPYMYPVLCPVPLHWTRLFSRGFNQSTLLAETLAEALTWKNVELLKRLRPTGHQAWRTREERQSALTDAFGWNQLTSEIPPWVVLIDDVYTTGTTLNECAKVLKQNGVKHVSGLVLAYG